MAGYVVKVGKKGELYTPKKLRSQIGLDPGSEFIAVVKDDEIIFRQRKTIINLLEEDAIATISEKEMKKRARNVRKRALRAIMRYEVPRVIPRYNIRHAFFLS